MVELNIAKKLKQFQNSQGITATLPDNIIRYKQVCLKHGIDTKTTKDILINKFSHYLNTKTVKEI